MAGPCSTVAASFVEEGGRPVLRVVLRFPLRPVGRAFFFFLCMQRVSVEYILELTRRERPGHINTRLLARLLQALVRSSHSLLSFPVTRLSSTPASSAPGPAVLRLSCFRLRCRKHARPSLGLSTAVDGPALVDGKRQARPPFHSLQCMKRDEERESISTTCGLRLVTCDL